MSNLYIICTGTIVAGGEIAWRISPLVEDKPADGELQRLIDEAEDSEDYEWDIEDRNIWRRGGW